MAEIVLALRVALSLGVVLLALWGLAKWYERRGTGAAGATSGGGTSARDADGRPVPRRPVPMRVVARAPLSRHASVALLDVGGRTLVVGVGEQQLTLLADISSDIAAGAGAGDVSAAGVAADSLGDGLPGGAPSASVDASGGARRAAAPLHLRGAMAQLMPMLRRGRPTLPGRRDDATTADGREPQGLEPAGPVRATDDDARSSIGSLGSLDSLDSSGAARQPDGVAADSFGSPVVELRAVPALADSLGDGAPVAGGPVDADGAADTQTATETATETVADTDTDTDTVADTDTDTATVPFPADLADAPVLSRRRRTERERAMCLHPAGKAFQVAAGTLAPLDATGSALVGVRAEVAPTVAALDGVQDLTIARLDGTASLDGAASLDGTVSLDGAARLDLAGAARELRRRRSSSNGPLAGSVLDPHSWSQAAEVLRSLRKAQ